MAKFIHCGDIHLDATFTGLGMVNKRLQKELLDANYEAFKRIVDLAMAEKVDFVLISGDLFDSPQRSLESQLRCNKQFAKLGDQGIKVFIVGGNHDPLREPFKVSWSSNVYFFSKVHAETRTLIVKDKKIYIHGMSYDNEKVETNLVKLLPRAISDGFNIGLLHCEVGGLGNYSPCTLGDIKEKNYDYFALGHIHQGNILSKDPYVVYSGCHQGKNAKEVGPKGCYLVTIAEDNQVNLNFIEVNSVQWFSCDIDIRNLSISELHLTLQESINQIGDKVSCLGAMVRFYLKGKGDLHNIALRELNDIVSDFNDEAFETQKFIWVESIQKQTSPGYDLESLAKQNDFLSTLLSAQIDGEIIFKDLEILNNRRINKEVGDLDKDKMLSEAKDKLIQALLGGEIGED